MEWKSLITKNWSLMRVIRLALSVFLLIEALRNYDVMLSVIGSVLFLQSVFNVGCCSNGACYTGTTEVNEKENTDVIFEEIKAK